MKRNQTFHEVLIPILVRICGAQSYLEFGTHRNETIGKVVCRHRYGVDLSPVFIHGVEFFRMDTAEFIKKKAAKVGPFDFVFIDADHSCRSVRQDFDGILPHVSPEGMVVLHDTNPELETDTQPGFCGDAWRAARAISVDYEAVTLPYHPGITIVRNREKWGPHG